FDVVTDEEWYFVDGRFDWHKTLAQWQAVIAKALARGLEGVRVFGNPWWRRIGEWRDMQEFEAMLEKTVAAWPMIMLCSYMTEKSDPVDVFDVASAHQCAIARRHGVWEFLEAPHNDDARRELDLLNGDLEIVPERIRGLLTERERVVLAQLVRGHSSKEVARSLGISPRTVDFHRANLMQKLGARNAAELIAKAVTGS
ncbi:MAG: MEDS domain-containing protein, partial [Alphaproteobacteria bacterium]|nr:MEDS domain-containing protein [Alphaproteobacteria bacterium]